MKRRGKRREPSPKKLIGRWTRRRQEGKQNGGLRPGINFGEEGQQHFTTTILFRTRKREANKRRRRKKKKKVEEEQQQQQEREKEENENENEEYIEHVEKGNEEKCTVGIPLGADVELNSVCRTEDVQEAGKKKSNFTCYIVRVTLSDGFSWVVSRRYREWRALYLRIKMMENAPKGIIFPTRFAFARMNRAQKVARRAASLQRFMNTLLMSVKVEEGRRDCSSIPFLNVTLAFLRFFTKLANRSHYGSRFARASHSIAVNHLGGIRSSWRPRQQPHGLRG